MSENITPTSADQSAQDRKRRRKALLAGGLVLGLGAAATLAAFSDDVFGSGSFNTGSFNIELSADGGQSWDEHDVPGDAAELTFTLDALQMAPAETVYAPLQIRIDNPSSLDGEITLTSTNAVGGLAGLLQYRLASGSATCNANTTFNWVNTATDVDTVAATTPVELESNGAGSNGTPIDVCLAVTLSSDEDAVRDAASTTNTSVTWGWTAESVAE